VFYIFHKFLKGFMKMKETISHYFSSLEDPRSYRNQKHPVMTIIGTSLLSVLSGIDSFSGMQDFTEAHLEALKDYFDFPNGFPSHDTYQRFWDSLCVEQFQACFSDFVESLSKVTSDVISLDGKTIRNSGRVKALHIVSAWCHKNQMVFGQKKVNSKSNEITAIPEVLRLLDLQDKTITMDAMGAQRDICQQIIDGGADYVIALKGNQGTLYEDVKLYLNDSESSVLINENNDKGHGRLEQRIASVAYDIDWLQENHSWPGLKAIAKIEATVWKKGKKTSDTRYYIASDTVSPATINTVARQHWGIENQLHWMLDVVFNEDKSCIRNDNAAENLDILRKWALTVLNKAKTKPQQSIKSLMRKNAMSINHLINTVNKILHA